jgi:predicted AAA+ superfamily ATPase
VALVGELLKQASWSDHVSGVEHWRTHDGHEVDLVVERDDGGVVGFEIKAGRQVHHHDFKGLLALRDTLGDQFHAGFLLTTGDTSYRHDDKLLVVSIDRLWQSAPLPNPRRLPR